MEAAEVRSELRQQTPAPGAKPLPTLLFKEHVDFAHVRGLGPREISMDDDPSHHVLPCAEL
jgi:hypothetical protein